MWFKVDDSFQGHPKAVGISNDSLATWTRAGGWAAWQLTDGVVPAGMLLAVAGDAADPEAVARDLVDRRLWELAEGGWQFHDWTDYNPTRAQVLAKRKADAERRRRYLDRRRDSITGRAGHAVTDDVTARVTDGVTDAVTARVTDPDEAATWDDRAEPPEDDAGSRRDDTQESRVPSRVRSHQPDPTRPEGLGRVQVDDQANLRNARAPEDGSTNEVDPDDELDTLVQALMHSKTGRSVSRLEAESIRRTLLSGRVVRDRAAYIRSALSTRKEARQFLPTLDPPQPGRLADVLGPRRNPKPEVAQQGAARARQLMAEAAEKAAANGEARQAPEPDPPPEQDPLPEADEAEEAEEQYPF